MRRGRAATPKSSPGDFQRRVRQVVTALAEADRSDVYRVASCIGTSVRTLQRRLRRVGLTYAGVLEQVHRQMAEQMLANLGDKIGDEHQRSRSASTGPLRSTRRSAKALIVPLSVLPLPIDASRTTVIERRRRGGLGCRRRARRVGRGVHVGPYRFRVLR